MNIPVDTSSLKTTEYPPNSDALGESDSAAATDDVTVAALAADSVVAAVVDTVIVN